MKQSNYNFIFEIDEDKALAFNAMSCALAEVENDFRQILEDIENIDIERCSKGQKQLIEQMKEGNFIIEDYVDELLQLKFKNNRGKYSSNTLGLTIAPTLLCNFKCPYCYETSKDGMMSEEVQKGIINMVEKNIKHIGNLGITWYGGEPLLAKKIIFSLSEQLIKLCEENNVEYSAFMVTNGYLLDEDTIDNILKYKIQSCQITIDGPPRIHNQRRVLKNNGETFNKIIDNVKLMRSKGGKVSIRVNIDKTNTEYIEELINILKDEDMSDIRINFGQVTAYTSACNSIEGNCLNTEEYSKTNIEFQKILHKHGFTADDYPYYPGTKGNYCCADQINSFVVDPEGYMYKCWNNIGMLEQAVGNILNIDEPDMEYITRHIGWINTDPFEGKCMECKLLPICMGGCPYMKKIENRPSCEKWIYNFEEMLKYTYNYKTSM